MTTGQVMLFNKNFIANNFPKISQLKFAFIFAYNFAYKFAL